MIQKLLKPLVSAAVEPLVKLAEKAGAAMGLALGLTVFVIGIALGVVITHHVGGVMLAALGAASGAVLMTVASSRLFRQTSSATADDQRSKELDDQNAKLRKELNEQRDLVHDLRREQGDSVAQVKGLKAELEEQKRTAAESEEKTVLLTREVCRLENQRINVDSVMPVLRLQLMSVQTQLRDWRHQAFNENRKEIKQIKSVGDYEFLGLLETECTAALGVDLEKLRLSENKDEIVVTGLLPGFHGFEKLKSKWIHHELREQERTATSLKSGELIVHEEDHRSTDLLQTYQSETLDRLNQGVDFKHLDQQILKMAEAFVRALLDRRCKPLRFLRTSPDVEGLTLNEFIRRHNAEVDRQMIELPVKSMEPHPPAKARRTSR